MRILKAVAKATGVRIEAIRSYSGQRAVMWSRVCCYYILRVRLELMLKEIAGVMNRNNHNCVKSGIGTAVILRETNPPFRRFWDRYVQPVIDAELSEP